jgi:hypothetical protein
MIQNSGHAVVYLNERVRTGSENHAGFEHVVVRISPEIPESCNGLLRRADANLRSLVLLLRDQRQPQEDSAP